MKKGFDANRDLSRYARSLSLNGFNFVCRYYNHNNPSKNLTAAEAHILSATGLAIVVVWENGFPTSPAYFSHSKGVDDGTSAYFYANQQIGQPSSTPIYFAVDYDASSDEINGPITDYFQGIKDGFNAISKNNPVYNIGVYGSGLACASLLKNNFASSAWLAQSMGWRGSKKFLDFNIKQSLQQLVCKEIGGGVLGDPNESPNDQEGSFMISIA